MISDERVVQHGNAPVNEAGRYVLYWMIAARRTRYNAALEHAAQLARSMGVPLLVFEPLRAGYRWASVRHHTFIIQGMRDNGAALSARGVGYFPYVEPQAGHGEGLLEALAQHATVVVTDTYPCFFLPRMVAAAASKLPVRLDEVDGNGILPLALHDRIFTVAHSFRRHFQKVARPYLGAFPVADPLALPGLAGADVPAEVLESWARADLQALLVDGLASLPIDQDVPAVDEQGGQDAGLARLAMFLDVGLPRYAEGRNDPDDDVSSGLSPWLHFGHVGAHEVVRAVLDRDGWDPDHLLAKANGKREGWWGASPEAEAFLDEVITWRELGYGYCHNQPDYDQFDTLPAWVLTTLGEHEHDPRPHRYSLDQLDKAQTHDPLWNAAQCQLVHDGRIHNYLRMLWGKKILEWSATPREALDVLIELNNRYALDGRDPNSYSGIFWTLGRFDRAWGPVRPIFGKVRYMSSENTARKVQVKQYISRWLGTDERVRGST